VLAVGNPFELNSTVTAGIVSAKARSINILSDKFKIESFIQTDAAINPGNSGGALINTNGELNGINTAIASRTGTYNGYAFAIPSKIVAKVIDDLGKYGEVQRGFLGISIRDVDAALAEKENLPTTKGVYVAAVNEKSAAEDAGIQKGDIVIKVDDITVNSASQLQEQIGRHRPGDKVVLTVIRDKKEKAFDVILKNKAGTTQLVKKEVNETTRALGANLQEASKDEIKELKIQGGVKVAQLLPGKLREAGVREGFIITHIDKQLVMSVKDVTDKLTNKQGGVMIEGIYSDGTKAFYAIGF